MTTALHSPNPRGRVVKRRAFALVLLTLLLAACATPPPSEAPTPREAGPSVAPAAPPTPPPSPPAPALPPSGSPSTASPPAPAGSAAAAQVPEAAALYVCETTREGAATRAPIEMEAKVAALCRRHPEMGPCQYAREQCRRNGGRVFEASGKEISRQTEAEYDRKVLRVKLRS